MLSILIPIYNFDIRPLVDALRRQAQELEIAWEICCIDDGSDHAWQALNRELASWPGVRYREQSENLGRARIRNVLAEAAHGEYLLFMDCDSMPPDEAFLQRYAALLQPDTLLYGGRAYQPSPPQDPALYFHWRYGSQREVAAAAVRQRAPYRSFMTNNFLVPKTVFQRIRFDGRLRRYGHEDTLFGLELEARGVPIVHLDNPLLHIGLEPAGVFLAKTRQGIQNLAFLEKSRSQRIDTRLLQAYRTLRRYRAAVPICWFLRPLRPLLERQLLSARPSLRLFDWYKLSCLLEELGCC